MVSRVFGAAQTPQIDDFRPAQKSCIKRGGSLGGRQFIILGSSPLIWTPRGRPTALLSPSPRFRNPAICPDRRTPTIVGGPGPPFPADVGAFRGPVRLNKYTCLTLLAVDAATAYCICHFSVLLELPGIAFCTSPQGGRAPRRDPRPELPGPAAAPEGRQTTEFSGAGSVFLAF